MIARSGRATWLLLIITILITSDGHVEGVQKPSAAYAPLFTGVIKLADVPAYASPGAPAVISPYGRKRRLYNFPPAPELSSGVLERVSDLQTSQDTGRRLQQHDTPHHATIHGANRFDLQSQSNEAAVRQRRAMRRANNKRRSLQGQLDAESAEGAKPARPSGWSGLWWAEAGGVGLAAGPGHLLHAVSTVLAVYTVDPVTGSKQASKIFALQDFFAPVGAANCREGVYDALPLYDKHAKRYLVAATCSGKGSVLLAASATSDPTGTWFLFNLVADAADTGMACNEPVVETALAEGLRVTYNSDGVFVSLFNYCPSNPATSGAAILALPKHKVYQGAPNFVYGVFTADQIAAALQSHVTSQDPSHSEAAAVNRNSIKQCQPAPPQTAADADAGAAFFVCDHIGPDAGVPRTAFALIAIVNTGALWQYVGMRETSPTCFLTAAYVDRGLHAPLSSRVMLQQPEGGSALHAGGTTPAGFWSGSAAYSSGKVFTVDRLDLTNMATAAAAATPVTMPSLMWTELDVKVLLTGAGDCTSTKAWGSRWNWNRDWSVDWGKEFDLEWEENKQEAEAIQQQIQELEAAMQQQQQLYNCTKHAAASVRGSSSSSSSGNDGDGEYMGAAAAATTEITDGTLGTIDGSSSSNKPLLSNCTAAARSSDVGSSSSSSDVATDQQSQQPSLTHSMPVRHRKLAASGSSASSSSKQQQQQQVSQDPLAGALAAATAASSSSSRYAMHWRGTPLPDPDISLIPLQAAAAAAAARAGSSGSTSSSRLTDDPSALRLNAYAVHAGWDLGCWYCTGAGGFFYSSGWFYRYWYRQWDFGWYRRYKNNYAPGWRQPGKFFGHRHVLQTTNNIPQAAAAAAAAADLLNITNMQLNESIIIPPCLQSGVSYKNTCKQCNYNNVTAKITVRVTRSGVISYLGDDPLGFVAPAITVIPDGGIVIFTSYSGPNKIPGSDIPAYPGVASLTISANSTTAELKILRPGTGKVRSRTGRWTDYSTADVLLLPAAATDTAAGSSGGDEAAAAVGVRLYYGVQGAHRQVKCSASGERSRASVGTAASSSSSSSIRRRPGRQAALCAMPAPWLGRMQL